MEIPELVNAKKLLLPYALGLLAAMVALHMYIGLSGGRITMVAQILLLVVAFAMVAWIWVKRQELSRLRFGPALVNSISFAIITTSFQLNAVIQGILVGRDGNVADVAHFLLETPWFGLTFGMSALWGIGLIFHLIGAILDRGMEYS